MFLVVSEDPQAMRHPHSLPASTQKHYTVDLKESLYIRYNVLMCRIEADTFCLQQCSGRLEHGGRWNSTGGFHAYGTDSI
jgi:hypothetical protein